MAVRPHTSPGSVQTSPWIRRRLCPGCGYAGAELQGDLNSCDYRCPHCEEDLYARPARSYGEMEGLIPVVETKRAAWHVGDWRVIEGREIDPHVNLGGARPSRLRRWISAIIRRVLALRAAWH